MGGEGPGEGGEGTGGGKLDRCIMHQVHTSIDKKVKVFFEMVHKNTLSPFFVSINWFLQCGFKHSSFLDT
jgi:hypothetical protein